jgi:hypothetical protein
VTITREELIELCKDGIVQHDKWSNRDSSSAQMQLGHCLVLLSAGCDYVICANSDNNTWWVDVWFAGFEAFEYGRNDMQHREYETFYIPTRGRLDRNKGEDWY